MLFAGLSCCCFLSVGRIVPKNTNITSWLRVATGPKWLMTFATPVVAPASAETRNLRVVHPPDDDGVGRPRRWCCSLSICVGITPVNDFLFHFLSSKLILPPGTHDDGGLVPSRKTEGEVVVS